MIRAGYSWDPTGFNNNSMGTVLDMNRGYVGYDSPLKDQMQQRMSYMEQQKMASLTRACGA